MKNLVQSSQPEHLAALKRLRAALEKWIEESNDQGRILEPPSVTARKGLTKAGPEENPNQQAIVGRDEASKKTGNEKKQ